METLNLPDFKGLLKINTERKTIYDSFRKKLVALTPEEWVRQNFLWFMVKILGYPEGLLSVEMPIELNGLKRRCDIVAFNRNAKPLVIIECKASSVKINQATFTQIATYNLKLKVDYLIVTNGLDHYCCKMNYEDNSFQFLENIPKYTTIQ